MPNTAADPLHHVGMALYGFRMTAVRAGKCSCERSGKRGPWRALPGEGLSEPNPRRKLLWRGRNTGFCRIALYFTCWSMPSNGIVLQRATNAEWLRRKVQLFPVRGVLNMPNRARLVIRLSERYGLQFTTGKSRRWASFHGSRGTLTAN